MHASAYMKKVDLEVDDGTFGSPDVAYGADGEKVLVSGHSLHSVGVGVPRPHLLTKHSHPRPWLKVTL